MKRTTISQQGVWDALLVLAVATLTAVAMPHTVAAQQADEGPVVEISPDDDVELPAVEAEPQRPAYWIGVPVGPVNDPVLRTQLQLAEGMGLVVLDVAADSPAQKAGLRQHDILIAVNGQQIDDREVLLKAVADSGGKPIELKLLRLAQETTVTVTPEEPPADAWRTQAPSRGEGPMRFQIDPGNLGGLFRDFAPGNMRMIGPGMIVGGEQFNLRKLPGDVAVTVTRKNDGPTKITVKRGDKTWTVEGEDEEALRELPDDVRPFVEQMLRPGQGNFRFRFEDLNQMIPQQLERALPEGARDRLQQRLEQMEKRLEDLQRRLDDGTPAESPDVDDQPEIDDSTT